MSGLRGLPLMFHEKFKTQKLQEQKFKNEIYFRD